MGWSYNSDRVSSERQELLLSSPGFDGIASRIIEEMRVTFFDVCRGKHGDVRGCRRPEFALEVTEEAFDLFFNGPHGYRGAYHKSPEDGEKANAKLISSMLDRLIEFAKDKPTKRKMTSGEIACSLRAGSAKIWIKEQGTLKQSGDDLTHPVFDLRIEPWLGTAQKVVADLHSYPDASKEPKAVDGVKAPEGTILEVKGAFLDENGIERIARDKKDRSHQIHLYGFS